MASNRNERRAFQKDGPKRRRKTRRQLREGGFSQWGSCLTHFKREREARLLAIIDREDHS